jgi:pilus assembly protein Flp/PilA
MLKLQLKLQELLTSLRDREEGQTLVEYGLILALISVAAIVIMGTVGDNVAATFTDVAAELVQAA